MFPLVSTLTAGQHVVQLIDRQEHGDFERRPRGAHARRRALSPSRQRLGALLRVRPQLQDSRRRARRVQGALQRGRAADGAVGLCGRRAVRSDREEAVLPRASRRARVQLRHARLRSALRLLPELGDVAGAARSARGGAAARRHARAARARRASSAARRSSSAPTTSR